MVNNFGDLRVRPYQNGRWKTILSWIRRLREVAILTVRVFHKPLRGGIQLDD